MYRIPALILLIVTASLMAGGSALAGPPSVVDQYTEQVPTPGGDVNANDNTGNAGQNGSGGPAQVITAGSPAGTGTSADGSPTAPSGNKGAAGSGSKGNGQTGTSKGSGQVETQTGSLSSAVIDGIAPGSGSNGMGWFFPTLLIVVAGIVAGFAIGRRRGRGHGLSG